MNSLIDYLRKVVLAGDEADLTDGQLLEHYLSHRDEAAVAALVRRHGPMVWGVCRRVLRNHHDSEDAFQATFLVLVRKAASIMPREIVGNWLYGVAHQTALKARATTAKRQTRERQVKQMPEPAAMPEADLWQNLEPLLDRELSRLPDKYRVAVVLCDLQRKTRKEAARQLKIPEGTLSSRLTTARTMLAKRLARHGLAVSGGALAVAVSQQAAPACMPPSVMASTIKAASLFAAGQVGGLISVKVAVLTEGVMRTMLLTKLKVIMAGVLIAFVIATGTIVLTCRTAAGQNDKKPTVEKPVGPEANKGEKKPPKSVSDQDRLQGTWRVVEVIVDGQPAQRQNPTEEANMIVRGDEMSMVALPEGKKVKEFRFKIDPVKMPKAIDLSVPTDQGKGKTGHGIYELESDRWKLCFPQDNNEAKDRPRNFKSEAGSRLVLMTLRREVKK